MRRRSRSVGSRAGSRRRRALRRRNWQGGSSMKLWAVSFLSTTPSWEAATTPEFGSSTSPRLTSMKRIISSDVGYPIDVYGTVIIRDSLDMKCNYIFRHDRDNCQHISSHGESLILTGPSRGVVFLGNAFFEIDLKIREGRECDDKQFNKALIDVVGSRISSVVQRETVDSWRSEVELIFAYVEKALEGTIEIKILSGPESFCGKITARTTDVSSHMLLYDSDVHGAITVGDDRVIQLLRRVVSVSEDKMLEFNIWTTSSDQNANTTHRQIEFTPLMKGSERDAITCGLYNLQIKVV
ncbi:hypothetical protein GQ55_5G186900 [Panicum hallii var. hallii]|uniref:DUF6598 domain-containing protein n=1 Tax=Panicum hallii var. hallii TaxID=1504633 RepID=A0A2T7DHS8_9POAL|nr:hypothetical protein GQ55_5G186900 [Panicum hallii var. hallii]